MAAGIAELVIVMKARDQASRVLAKTGTAGQKAGQMIQQHWKAASVALAGAAAAIEVVARAQAEHTKIVQQLSAQQGLSNREIRDLARDLSNVTFPLEDVLSLLQTATQQGIEGTAALSEYARFWDMVGDASGTSGAELGKAGIALKAVGIDVGQETKALAALGFIQDKTTTSVREFLTFIEKVGPDLRRANMDINDTAALLAAMEKELGLAGRTARSEFRTELEAAKGDLDVTLKALGLTTDQVAKYRAQVSLASGVIERNAAIHEASFTTLQKAQHQMSELAFANGEVIQAAAQLAPLLLAVGPAAMIAQVGIKVLRLGLLKLKISMATTAVAARAMWLAITGPIGLVILGITGVVAAGYLIVRNWNLIRRTAQRVFGLIFDLFKSKWGWLLPGGALIKGLLFIKGSWAAIWDGIRSASVAAWDAIRHAGETGINLIIHQLNRLIRAMNKYKVVVGRAVLGPGGGLIASQIPDIPEIPSFGRGGTVPGPAGSPQLIMAHGGERITPAGQGGGDTFVFQFPNYAGDKRDVEEAVMGAMVRLQRRGRISAVTT